jgi:hypothetical protein
VKWEGFTHEENTWESYENVSETAHELLKEFYDKNPMMEKDGRFEKDGKSRKDKKKRRGRRK